MREPGVDAAFEGADPGDSFGIPYPFAFILSIYRPSMRLANSAGDPMARDIGTMNALTTMSPQMAAE